MGEVIANAPAAGDKATAGLSKEESARFFGPPPLIAGEDQAQYEAMRDQISAAVGPLDFLEEIWPSHRSSSHSAPRSLSRSSIAGK
jgi:hypothetical protein